MASIIKLTKLILKCYSLLIILILVSFLTGTESYAQTPTIGLLVKKPEVTDGYTLFTPESNQNVYLINNCGKKVNEWVFSEKPGATCYLLDNGHLLRAGKDSLEIRDWDSKLIWSYAMNDNDTLPVMSNIFLRPTFVEKCLVKNNLAEYCKILHRGEKNKDYDKRN